KLEKIMIAYFSRGQRTVFIIQMNDRERRDRDARKLWHRSELLAHLADKPGSGRQNLVLKYCVHRPSLVSLLTKLARYPRGPGSGSKTCREETCRRACG